MRSRSRRGHQRPQPQPQPQPLRGELWLVFAMAVLIATIALLHLAVERERAGGSFQFDLQQLMSEAPVKSPVTTMSLQQEMR